MVELATGMILGGPSWLNAVARNADLAYGMAHRPNGLFSQSWYLSTPQGVKTVWQGETVYDGKHANMNLSAWADLPAAAASNPYAKLQLYYAAAWHDVTPAIELATSGAAVSGWIGDYDDVDGVLTFDISYAYNIGDIIRARIVVQGNGNTGTTSVRVYRACLGGFAPEWPDSTAITWPTFPTWSNATPHSAANFNTLRNGAEYLKQCAERPLVGEECVTAQHRNGDAQIVAAWSFRKGGQDKLTVVVVSTRCDGSNPIKLFIADEQYPNGANTTTTVQLGSSITTNTTTTFSIDLTATDAPFLPLTMGDYYSILLQATDEAVAQVTSIHMADLAGETRANVPPPSEDLAHGEQPTAIEVAKISDDMKDMQPVGTVGSPLWYEHTFSTHRGFNQDAEAEMLSLFHYSGRRWRFWHTFPYLRYRGGGRITSDTGAYTASLGDSSPAGGDQIFELDSLPWLASGDWYYVQDTDNAQILTAYEDWSPYGA